MNAPPIRLPSGVRDLLPRAAARRRAVAERVMSVFEAWGYARIVTPVFECADVLERGLGHDARAAAIRFVEPGTGEIVALRPDITPQVARLVATRLADLEGPIRLCYEGAVTRLAGELGQRELLQAGIELIDLPEPEGDAEVLAVAAAALAATRLPETRLDIGHVAPARHVLGALDGAPGPVVRAAKPHDGDARAAPGPRPAEIAPLAEALVTLWGPAEATLERAAQLAWPDEVRAALARLRRVIVVLGELADPPAPSVTIDLGDLRGFDYYTGVRFAGYAGGAPDAVLRGGRYDELIGRYGRAAHATGFAIDLEAIAEAQRAVGVAAPPVVLGIAVHGGGAARLARALRGRGLRAVTAAVRPTPSWLRGAGLDAALVLDAAGRRELVLADDSRRDVATAVSSLMEE
ncbi:MAG TPA: ATP phosphoribosyltransferase regulatory subunit [Kofleriaceae bacterium]|nr:ATP phosphoribosyltransferase regulatory subunit [Kofleriaceae bacterium]